MFDVTADDCLFRATPLTFDPSLIDIFLAIHSGASLCLFSDEIRRNPISVSVVFDHSQCTIAQVGIASGRARLTASILDDTEFLPANERAAARQSAENARARR